MADYKENFKTKAVNHGGRDGGASRLTDRDFHVDIAAPGSNAEGTNPEELFALGYSACFNSALGVVKKAHGVEGDSLVGATVHMYVRPTNDFKLSVELEVGVEGITLNEAHQLANEAHEVCPYSKATKGNINVTVKAVDYDELKNA
ncbi:MAG: Ohr family peroxiredoxin [Aerococcus sp.]|nr:Ohr family peroxiredoxin [Aerococcus sp.]